MLKLYKQIDGELHYWEAWDTENKSYIIHWGKVGEEGEHTETKLGRSAGFEKAAKKQIDQKLAEGYSTIEEDDHVVIEIAYKINGMGTRQDKAKRDRLESEMNELLGWTGLGRYDGFGMGKDSMEVCCLVVDFDIALKVISDKLKGTEFENYIGINVVNAD